MYLVDVSLRVINYIVVKNYYFKKIKMLFLV